MRPVLVPGALGQTLGGQEPATNKVSVSPRIRPAFQVPAPSSGSWSASRKG